MGKVKKVGVADGTKGATAPPKCVRSFADAIMYIPQAVHATTIHAYITKRSHNSFHSLFAPNSTKLFAPQVNANPNSELAWNPVYYIIGRPNSTRVEERLTCSAGYSTKG